MVLSASGRPRGALPALLALLAFAGLFQSTILTLVDPALLGWQPDHGHVFTGGVAQPHSHPWDHEHTDPPGHGEGVVFTFGELGAAGSVAAAVVLPAGLVLLHALAAPSLVARARTAPGEAAPPAVLLPPPRG
ncbi:MAG: hypothetical protein WD734_01915 [Dehalococcoidia bacterium]